VAILCVEIQILSSPIFIVAQSIDVVSFTLAIWPFAKLLLSICLSHGNSKGMNPGYRSCPFKLADISGRSPGYLIVFETSL